jgi:cytochrome c biogenesis protein CcmG/thiol:disulfide interchange protein DsbE
MRRILYILPILAFIGLVYLFFRGLNGPPPDELPSALVGKPAPATNLPPLDGAVLPFATADFRSGHVTVLNVWASWCVPCRAEAPALAALSQLKGVALYGMVYEDKSAAAREFLMEAGNPFSRIDLDRDGRAGIEWGIYGVPETFVIDPKGIVRLRYAGPIVGDTMNKIILPAIADARTAG